MIWLLLVICAETNNGIRAEHWIPEVTTTFQTRQQCTSFSRDIEKDIPGHDCKVLCVQGER